jgi:hypothetical protein
MELPYLAAEVTEIRLDTIRLQRQQYPSRMALPGILSRQSAHHVRASVDHA